MQHEEFTRIVPYTARWRLHPAQIMHHETKQAKTPHTHLKFEARGAVALTIK